MTMERVKECVTDAAKELGYPEQLDVAATFIEGRDFGFAGWSWLHQMP